MAHWFCGSPIKTYKVSQHGKNLTYIQHMILSKEILMGRGGNKYFFSFNLWLSSFILVTSWEYFKPSLHNIKIS